MDYLPGRNMILFLPNSTKKLLIFASFSPLVIIIISCDQIWEELKKSVLLGNSEPVTEAAPEIIGGPSWKYRKVFRSAPNVKLKSEICENLSEYGSVKNAEPDFQAAHGLELQPGVKNPTGLRCVLHANPKNKCYLTLFF